MERIQAAIQKAKDQRSARGVPDGVTLGAPPMGATTTARAAARPQPGAPGPAWAELESFDPDPRVMKRNRIVTFDDTDPAHVNFDILRTKILRIMRQNGWTSIGITSPTAGCGKTTTSVNLAFSLAHQPDVRTVLIDLDLRRPSVAHEIGLTRPQSVAGMLHGTRTIPESFVRYGDSLAIGTNSTAMKHTADLLLNPVTVQGVAALKSAFQADIYVYDLPPMLQSDDVMAFVPHLDCMLLVAGAERSRLDEVDKCEHELSEQTNVLGVVLNMCRYTGEDYGYY